MGSTFGDDLAELRWSHDGPVAFLTGDIDRYNAGSLTEAILRWARPGHPLTVDLTAVGYVDSGGADVMLAVLVDHVAPAMLRVRVLAGWLAAHLIDRTEIHVEVQQI